MPSEFLTQYISIGFAAILVGYALLALLLPNLRFAGNWLKGITKIGTPLIWTVLIGLVGFAAGGGTYLLGMVNTASISSADAQQLDSQTLSMLDYCTYTAGTSSATGVTIRTDPNSQNRVFLDVDETAWNATFQLNNEANLTFSCVRSGNVDKAATVEVIANAAKFFAETTVSDSTEYSIVERSTVPSIVWNGEATKTIYLEDGAYATASSTKEKTFLEYAEGAKTVSLGVRVEVDATGYSKLNNYTQKDVTIFQRVSGSDKVLGYVTVNKVP